MNKHTLTTRLLLTFAAGLFGMATALSAQTGPGDAFVNDQGQLVIGGVAIDPPEGTVDSGNNLIVGGSTIPPPVGASIDPETGDLIVDGVRFPVPTLEQPDREAGWYPDALFALYFYFGNDWAGWYAGADGNFTFIGSIFVGNVDENASQGWFYHFEHGGWLYGSYDGVGNLWAFSTVLNAWIYSPIFDPVGAFWNSADANWYLWVG